jgi:putative Holliday junction resolvase
MTGRQERYLGVDIGLRRVGLAVSGSDPAIPLPKAVLQVANDDEGALAEDISKYAEREGAKTVVIGYPPAASGSSRQLRSRIEAIRARLQAKGLTVHLVDERYTTRLATALKGPEARRRDARVDAEAAALILETFLASRAARG